MWRINWSVCVCLLLVLLPCSFRHVRIYADVLLLWLHGLHLLWLLPNAWYSGLPRRIAVCTSYLPIHQMWVAYPTKLSVMNLRDISTIRTRSDGNLDWLDLLRGGIDDKLRASCSWMFPCHWSLLASFFSFSVERFTCACCETACSNAGSIC